MKRTNGKQLQVLLVVSMLAGVLALAACSSSSKSDPSGPTSAGGGSSSVVNTSQCPEAATQTLSGSSLTIGTTGALSGPAAAAGVIMSAMKAYFDYVNSQGGVDTADGKKQLSLKMLDDQYAPSKTLAAVQRLVQQDNIKVIGGVSGTANSEAAAPYLKAQCIPQLAPQGSPAYDKSNPWLSYDYAGFGDEAAAWVKYMVKNLPEAKTVAVLYQNDDVGKAALAGLKAAVAGTDVKVVAEQSYEPNTVNVSSQMTTLAGSKAAVFLDAAVGVPCTQSFTSLASSSWRPVSVVVGSCGDSNLAPAPKEGLSNVYGVQVLKSTTSPDYKTSDDMVLFKTWMAKEKLAANFLTEDGWYGAEIIVNVLKQAKPFTPAGIANAAAKMPAFTPGLMYPGVTIHGWANSTPVIDTFAVTKYDAESSSFSSPVATVKP